ncbi:MAG TPA: BRO family protein [Dictyobacter sp.]|jgi:hypothetical protein|nr:BRO family protein [Dictyobacter sp.]
MDKTAQNQDAQNKGKQLTIVEQFEDFSIRKSWYQEEWWYALVDVVAVFSGTSRARKYWYDLKKKIIEEEGYHELSEKIGQLKFAATDGKSYKTDAANFHIVSRVLQSIRSPQAEPFKQWLAGLATQEVEAIEDPEQALERLRQAYERMGRDPQWIKVRLEGIEIRKRLTDQWQIRGIVAGWEYAILTNRISEETFGIPTREHKEKKGLKRQDLREHYTVLEHALINLSEAATHEFTEQRNSYGFDQIQQDALDGGRVGGRARKDLEQQGLKVVSEQNFLPPSRRKKKELPAAE